MIEQFRGGSGVSGLSEGAANQILSALTSATADLRIGEQLKVGADNARLLAQELGRVEDSLADLTTEGTKLQIELDELNLSNFQRELNLSRGTHKRT